MITKVILGSAIALALSSVIGDRAAQAQYPAYQTYPYQSQYPAQPQYAPVQPQYAPAQPQYAQPQYAPAQTAYPQMPDYCMQNNAAAGAATGAVIGGLIGGLAGGGRGALIGAGSGMLFGGLSGAQADAQCEQIAVQIAYQQAAAQQAAIEQQIAAQAARRRGTLTLPASAYVPVSADYVTPSDKHRHRVTVKRLNSFSDPASRQICDNFTRIDFDLDGNTSRTASARRCKGPDGKWRDS
jgi:hypothetical protein